MVDISVVIKLANIIDEGTEIDNNHLDFSSFELYTTTRFKQRSKLGLNYQPFVLTEGLKKKVLSITSYAFCKNQPIQIKFIPEFNKNIIFGDFNTLDRNDLIYFGDLTLVGILLKCYDLFKEEWKEWLK